MPLWIFSDGITHSERFERARREGGRMNGIQAWVALPDADEETEPAFSHYGTAQLPLIDAPGVRGRLIAGDAFGQRSAVRTHSPMYYLHWDLDADVRIELPSDQPERAAYVAAGAVEIEGRRFAEGQMVVFGRDGTSVVRALEPSTVMGLGGQPLGPRYIDWNFVSSSKERIAQAKADWRAGRMKLPDLDDADFIPLPAESHRPPNPMS